MNKYKKYYNKTKYLSIYEKTSVVDKTVLLESQQGKNLNGNIFYLLKELMRNKEYKNYKVFLSVNENCVQKFKLLLNKYTLNPDIVIIESKKYFQILSSAQYLITDTSFTPNFIKKDNQIILNVWHGTPLKHLGKKDNSSLHSIGNVQKNFIVSDYLLYPNEYMMNHMIEDYMLENICNAKCLLHGYPRNEIFFEPKNEEIINKYNLNNMEIIGYMPTWRGTISNIDDEISIIKKFFQTIDMNLNDNQILLVNLHPFIDDIMDYSEFQHIMPFPCEYETYEVLNLCDQLITDYSSVFYDYANTRRKIILFTYDLEKYIKDRGLYISIDSLPFPIVETVEDLIKEINSSKNYDDTNFMNTYCLYDNHQSTSNLLRFIFKGEKKVKVLSIKNNNKKNILMYVGNLDKNGITTSLMNLLQTINTEKYNYYLTFNARNIVENKDILKKIPDNINYISMLGMMNGSIMQKIILIFSRKLKSFKYFDSPVFDKLYQYEIKRCFGNISFSNVIQFNGYEFKYELMFGRFQSNRIIYVHSNMIEEIKTKHNQHPNVLKYAYNHYDKVAIVTKDMKEPTLLFCDNESRIKQVRNIINYQKVIKKAQEEIKFDDVTCSNVELNDLKLILSSNAKKFITIGRFSQEKGHIRLLDCYNQIYKNYPNTYFIIIGGVGKLYDETLKYTKSLECSHKVICIKSVSNPYPILKKCDYFVLGSYYEAFGLVLAEANILGLPVFSTDILGPRGFMKKYNGLLVENSNKGILHGMEMMLEEKVQVMDVDYEKYNREAIEEFESLLVD